MNGISGRRTVSFLQVYSVVTIGDAVESTLLLRHFGFSVLASPVIQPRLMASAMLKQNLGITQNECWLCCKLNRSGGNLKR